LILLIIFRIYTSQTTSGSKVARLKLSKNFEQQSRFGLAKSLRLNCLQIIWTLFFE